MSRYRVKKLFVFTCFTLAVIGATHFGNFLDSFYGNYRVKLECVGPQICFNHSGIRNGDIPSHSETFRQTELSDVFIGVKTAKQYHNSRLQLILDTWYSLAPEQIYFFTDVDTPDYQDKTSNHMVNTKCAEGHSIRGLCCKLSTVFSVFNESNKRWLCHVDDDNYLNVPELIKLLRLFDHNQDFYIGRESLPYKKKCRDTVTNQDVNFWFATGGAGVCYSNALVAKMMIYASRENLHKTCSRLGEPDDVTVGFIVESLLNKTLTKVYTFNSHLQTMADVPTAELKNQVTFGYNLKDKRLKDQPNVINMTAIMDDDPTRLKSFHCTYFRDKGNCPSN